MARWITVRRSLLVACAAALTACSEPATGPSFDAPEPTLNEVAAPALLECTVAERDFAWTFLGRIGGLLSLNGSQIRVPFGALTGLVFMTIRQPATSFVEIEVRVNGREHFQFARPVTVTLDYSRCDPSMLGPGPLMVWEIDPVTKAFIRDMNGVDDREAQKISFTTDHFSGYAVAQ